MSKRAPRGEYRSIEVVQLDEHQFRQLSERQRWLLVVTRLSIGPCGIAAMPGFFHVLADRTGIPVAEIAPEWEVLQRQGLCYYDGVTAWLVDGLSRDPGRNLEDWRHRKSVRDYVAGLPCSALVGAFVAHNAEWWARGSEQGEPLDIPVFPAPDAQLAAWISSHPSMAPVTPPEGSSRGHLGVIEGASKGEAGPPQGSGVPHRGTDTDTDTDTETEEQTVTAQVREPWTEERLRKFLPAHCHANLHLVLVNSRKGAPAAAHAIASMAQLFPSAISPAAGMQFVTPDVMAQIINRLATTPEGGAWSQPLVDGILRKLQNPPRTHEGPSANRASRRPVTLTKVPLL